MNERKPVAVVAGVGPGNGIALARRFARGGYSVAILGREDNKLRALAADIEGVTGFACDVTDPDAVAGTFSSIARTFGNVDVLLFNAGSGVFKSVEDITPQDFEKSWRVNAYAALLCSQAVIPAMKTRGAGAILFTGATASLRGGISTAAFAPAKAAQRSLAESMARALWPKGIHVALIIVDGVVDIPRTRAALPSKDPDYFVAPAGVADIAWFLAHQDRQAWSFELEARPYGEKW